MEVVFLTLFFYMNGHYVGRIIPVPMDAAACEAAGLRTGYARAEENPAYIDGKPNLNLPLKMWSCQLDKK